MAAKSFADIFWKHWMTLRPFAGDKLKGNSLSCEIRYMLSTCAFPEYTELPGKLNKSERKPFVVPINELKRKAQLQRELRQEVREVNLRPPENGLLLKRLIPVAHEVYASRSKLFYCVSRLIDKVGVHRCRACAEVHVGHMPHTIRTCNAVGSRPTREHSWEKGGIEDVLPIVESFHLYDRLGRAVSHKERVDIDRLPAIVELCIQAGIDLPEYPTRRRVIPVYSISGKIIDFERRYPRDGPMSTEEIQASGFWEKRRKSLQSIDLSMSELDGNGIRDLAEEGLEAWERLRSGATRLMQKYGVQVCGYCPEVQVGPKGHRVRTCQAHKHQQRDGQHAWQEATVDEIVPPVHVWHVRNPGSGEVIVDELRWYYGKLPAVVELCSQAGAQVGKEYWGMTREDVSLPDLEEVKLVV
ncbi:APO protein 3, mitochondrial-like [Nymphaea colorata]|uniref:APO protein 3, mitochondrial-like n=1 Tax=Nymphaea colorata TaxID=210225 RepID=UPI00129E1871|nr:APO protein 3, mitochondrial-like [Nymphaea colorata]XP_031484432.1 APO protein 3, mitochondrial-like [Nymphaea colorata]